MITWDRDKMITINRMITIGNESHDRQISFLKINPVQFYHINQMIALSMITLSMITLSMTALTMITLSMITLSMIILSMISGRIDLLGLSL